MFVKLRKFVQFGHLVFFKTKQINKTKRKKQTKRTKRAKATKQSKRANRTFGTKRTFHPNLLLPTCYMISATIMRAVATYI